MDQRTAYVEKLSAQMVEWDNEIEKLKDRAQGAPADDQAEFSRAIAALTLKRDEVARKLQGISLASDHEWEEMKAGTDKVWEEVRTGLRDAIMKIK